MIYNIFVNWNDYVIYNILCLLVWRIVEFLREAIVETNSLHSISSVFFYRILFYSTLFFVVLHSSNSIILVFWFLLCWFKFSKNRINTRIIWNFIKIEISTLRKIWEKFQNSIFHNFRKFSVKYFYLFLLSFCNQIKNSNQHFTFFKRSIRLQ